LEARLKTQQDEIDRLRDTEGEGEDERRKLHDEMEAMRRRQAEIESEARRLQDARQNIRERVETMLTRLEKLDLD
jgi:septal ring factor EnvC (AmiA/AmiB activator)